MMRFVHSLNTDPIFVKDMYGIPTYYRLVGTLIYSAMSLCWVKCWGHEIVLHTDTAGKKLLGFLPYDEIHLTLDEMKGAHVHPRFWAAAKMFAMENEPLGSIHIDNDVFIKRKKAYDLIEQDDSDLMVQEYESGDNYDMFTKVYDTHVQFLSDKGVDINLAGAFNTGILRFNNPELKDMFIRTYKDIVAHVSELSSGFLDNDDPDGIPDLIAEQKLIHQMCGKHGYKVFELLGETRNVSTWAHDIGYQHLLTSMKYTKLEKVLEMLSQVCPMVYIRVAEECVRLNSMNEYDGHDISIIQERSDK